MKPPASPAPRGDAMGKFPSGDGAEEVNDEETSVPGFRSWRRVYILVLATFILWVVLLAALSTIYS